MSRINNPVHLLVAIVLCGAMLAPIAAQAHGRATRGDKVVDAATLPILKVLHFGKKTGESAERRVGHMGDQVI